MTITRFYEATIVDDTDPTLTAHVFSVPAQSLGEKYQPEEPQYLLSEYLGFETLVPIPPGNLVPALAACLEHPQDFENIAETLPYYEWRRRPVRPISPKHLAFAEHVTLAPLVPFEQSPLVGAPLGTIFATGSGGAMGAYLGVVMAGGPTPLLIITVPAGMIICGAAMGVAEGLQHGLRRKLTRAIGGPDRLDVSE